MFYNGDDDDQDFLSPSGGSKLASLFGMDRAAQQGGNESLKYTAPKEPKKSQDAPQSGQPASVVLCFAPVHAYKYIDEKYASQGQVGAVVIGSHSTGDYKILLYITKEKPLTFARIHPSFGFVIQPNNYATFYDDARLSWSVLFESETSLTQFAKQVALARYSGSRDALDLQDLTLGEGGAAEVGDSVEIKYTGWLLENHTFGTIFESNSTADKLMRFRLGKCKGVKAWDEGVTGMKKNGKRLLIAPASVAYTPEGRGEKVPAAAVVIFEVELVRVKFVRDRGNEGSQGVREGGADDEREDGVKARSRSISDQLTNQPVKSSDKAKLITRMARMGQPLLPVTSPTADFDSEAPPVVSPSASFRPEVPAKPGHQGGVYSLPGAMSNSGVQQQALFHGHVPGMTSDPLMMAQQSMGQPFAVQPPTFAPQSNIFQGTIPSNQMAVYQPQAFQPMMGGFSQFPGQQPYAAAYNQTPMYQQAPPQAPPPAAPSTAGGDTNVPMLLMETRQQNTEVRVALSKVTDKVERIAEKIDQLQSRQSASLALTSSMPSMEVGMLVHNIERIVQDNERMKKEVMEKSSRIDLQNVKITELLQSNQHYMEQSNAMMERRNDSFMSTASQSQARVQTLEKEKVLLATELSELTSQLASCQLDIATARKKEGELKQQLEKVVTSDTQSRESLAELKLHAFEDERKSEKMAAQLRDEQQLRKQLQAQLSQLQESTADLTAARDAIEKSLFERKKKSSDDVAKLESELDDMKKMYESELASLKQRLKNEKNSTELTAAQQASQLEEELTREWKEKCDRLVSSCQDRHQRELREVTSDKKLVEEKVATLESKIVELKLNQGTSEQELDVLREEIVQLRIWKEKYDALRSQASTMKEHYVERIAELEEERDAVELTRETATDDRDRAVERARQLQAQLSRFNAGNQRTNDPSQVAGEVKKVMNSVYHRLRAEFDADEAYPGTDVQSTILKIIKTVTLEMMQAPETRHSTDKAATDSEESEEEEEAVLVASQLKSSVESLEKLPADEIPAADHRASRRDLEYATDETANESLPPHASDVVSNDTVSSDTVSSDLLSSDLVSSDPVSSTRAEERVSTDETDECSDIAATSELKYEVETIQDDTVRPPCDSTNQTGNTENRVEDEGTVEDQTTAVEKQAPEAPTRSAVEPGEDAEIEEDSFASVTSNTSDDLLDKTEHVKNDSAVPLEAEPADNSATPSPNSSNPRVVVEDPLSGTPPPFDAADHTTTPLARSLTSTEDHEFSETLEYLKEAIHDKESVAEAKESVAEAVAETREKQDEDGDMFGKSDQSHSTASSVHSDTPTHKKKTSANDIFGDDDDDEEDLFSSPAKKSTRLETRTGVPAESNTKPTDPGTTPTDTGAKPMDTEAKPTDTGAKKTNRNESEDDLNPKPPPLPLFGDEDNDDDLDWLS